MGLFMRARNLTPHPPPRLVKARTSAVTLERLAKDANGIIKDLQQKFKIYGLLGNIKEFGKAVKDTADLVLKGTHNIAWLQARLPSVLNPVDHLLSAPVRFPDPFKYLDDDDDVRRRRSRLSVVSCQRWTVVMSSIF